MIGGRKVRDLQSKKPRMLARLIKCYVCSEHFQSQGQFDIHLKQHQNKLNRTNLDEIQRKTQESFHKHKQSNVLSRTQTNLKQGTDLKERERPKDNRLQKKEETLEDRESMEIEDALRESQIMLEKIEFMTQVQPLEDQQEPEEEVEQELQYFEKRIEGERKLNQLIQKADSNSNLEKLILQTEFETRYFQNYQEQLTHLRLLTSFAANSNTITKIMDIRRKICRDVCQQLKEHFEEVQEVREKPRVNKAVKAQITQNTGKLRFCADCFSQIGGMDDLYSLQCGHSYHPDCWNGQCCS